MKKPTPHQVEDSVAELARIRADGEAIPIPLVVAKLRDTYGCSRATAYRAVSDALAADAIARRET